MISLFIQQAENGWIIDVRDDKEPPESKTQTWVCGTKRDVLDTVELFIEREAERKRQESAKILSNL